MTASGVELKKCLASYSVFREIYDKEKDIYDVLSEFIVDVVRNGGKHQFSSIEIVGLLIERFSFTIPDAVVRNALKRIRGIRRADNLYYPESLPKSTAEFDRKLEETVRQNDAVLEQLYTSIEERYHRPLSPKDRDDVTQDFASFLLDREGANSRFSKAISGFVIMKSDDPEFIRALSHIKEGLVLYSGLQYTPEEFSTLKWDHDLVLFLDTDVIFSIAGLNGEMRKALAHDFVNLVREVNTKSQRSEKRSRIELRYFTEVEQEVVDFFAAAEYKVNEPKKGIESKTAMIAILDGCRSKSDVVAKRNALFAGLAAHSIKKDETSDYYSDNNHKFYIESEDNAKQVIKSLGRTWAVEDVRYGLRLLSLVNILRKDKKPRFEDAKYFLVTGNGMYHEIGKLIARERGHDTQLDTSVEFLTDKLWVKLNKGFGKDPVPKVFSVVAKAQMILASQLNVSVGLKYTELEEKVRKKEISIETAQLSLSDFRQRVLPAERINSTNVEEMIEFTELSVQDTVQEYEFARVRFEKQIVETEKLRQDLEEKDRRLEVLERAESDRVERELRRKRRNRGIVLVGLPAFLWIGGLLLLFATQLGLVAIVLGAVGIAAQIMGVLRFFGLDAKEISERLKKL